MNKKKRENLIYDIHAVFDLVVYVSEDEHWIGIQLAENVEVTANDFPHLLTIARGYNVTINVYPVALNQLGIFFKEV